LLNIVDRALEILKDGAMKRDIVLTVLSLVLAASAQAGIVYGGFSPSGTINPGEATIYSDATVSGFGSVLQSYTLNLTFGTFDNVGNIHGALVLTPLAGTPTQTFDLSGFTTTDELTYSETFSSGSLFSQNPNTTWTLSLFSLAPGDANTAVSWTLDITAVPEPINVALGIFAGLFVVGGLCRTQRVRDWLHQCRVNAVRWVDAV
jgi:hypothetical protein